MQQYNDIITLKTRYDTYEHLKYYVKLQRWYCRKMSLTCIQYEHYESYPVSTKINILELCMYLNVKPRLAAVCFRPCNQSKWEADI